ncbi:MAG: sulfite exporter TauE/SafE family protein [Bdellovibrionales bacterium]
MNVYLPVAEMALNGPLIIFLGFLTGILSGMFGVGGGFILTPMLVFVGVPPAIAVGTQSCQLMGTSISGALAHWQRRQIDLRMGMAMVTGGILGTAAGVALFKLLREKGYIDLTITLGYFLLLAGIGGMMMYESLRSRRRRKAALASPGRLRPPLGASWPFKTIFPASRLRISILGPVLIGFASGVLVGVFGIGGGFILIPAMLYLLRMPSTHVNGTALFQIIFAAALGTILQTTVNHSVDLILAFFLLAGSVIGAQLGTRYARLIKPDTGRFLLAALILLIAVKLFFDLVIPPQSLFSHEMRYPT